MLILFAVIFLVVPSSVLASETTLFYDDFTADTTSNYTSEGPTAVWNEMNKSISITGSSWKGYQKLFSNDMAQSGKIVIEYGIVSMSANKGRMLS